MVDRLLTVKTSTDQAAGEWRVECRRCGHERQITAQQINDGSWQRCPVCQPAAAAQHDIADPSRTAER